MAAVDPPRGLSYAPPLLNFDAIGELGKDFYKGAENRQKYQLDRALQDGVPKDANGNPDMRAYAELLAKGGRHDLAVPQLRDELDRSQAQQGNPYASGATANAMPQTSAAATSPRMPTPAVSAAPAPQQRIAPQQPALSSAGADNEGAQTVRGMATEIFGGRDVSALIPRFAAAFKVDPDAPLSPEQAAALKPVMGKSLDLMGGLSPQKTAQAAPAPQQPSQAPQGGNISNVAGANALAQANGFPDYRTAITKLRQYAAQNAGNPRGTAGAAQATALANEISETFLNPSKVGEVARSQSNLDREFTEKQRQHAASEMTPVKIGVGAFGEELYAVKDPVSGGFRMIDPKTGQLGPVQGGGAASAPAKESTISAKDLEFDRKAGRNVEYLQSLDPAQQGIVRKMANYEMNPTSLSIKGGHRERVLAAVADFDPSYDQKNYTAFSEGLRKFGTSKQGDSVRSFNVGIEHIDQLLELGRALDNGDIPKINEIKNWVKQNLGHEAPTNFNGLKAIVGAEIVKAIVGAGGTGEERAAAAKTVSGASSLTQLEGIAKTYASAMGAQLGGLQRQYEQSTGRKDFDRLLSPQAIRYRDSHNAPSAGASPSASGEPKAQERPAGKPKTVIQGGHTYELQPDGSYK